MSEKLNVLLTGASGAIGSEVLKQLSGKLDQYRLTVFDIDCKRARRMFRPFQEKIEIVYGDILNSHDVDKASHDKHYVIHLAAVIPPIADEDPLYANQVNVIGTSNLVAALTLHSPDAFLLYSSSVSIYGDRLQSPWIKVGDSLHPSEGDEYAKTKIKAEEIIRNSSLDWTIFRLSAIMGGHKISKLMFHMPLNTSMEIATPKDTARAFINGTLNQAKLSKGTFNLGGGSKMRLTYRELLNRHFEIFGLGSLNFPEHAFAERNFHCGFYKDGDELEGIVGFQEDTLETYFESVKKSVPGVRKVITSIFKSLVKLWLAKLSEPLLAVRSNDEKLIDRFFFKWKSD